MQSIINQFDTIFFAQLDNWVKIIKKLLFSLSFAIFIIHLVKCDSGIYDYWLKEKLLEEKAENLIKLKIENDELYSEIIKIQTDQFYQRQLIKEHLGHLAKDEFLILFAKEKK